jgi:hypothetical protein
LPLEHFATKKSLKIVAVPGRRCDSARAGGTFEIVQTEIENLKGRLLEEPNYPMTEPSGRHFSDSNPCVMLTISKWSQLLQELRDISDERTLCKKHYAH